MKASPQQQKCYHAAAHTSESFTIDSVAGSGKTFTLGGISSRLSGNGLSTSFSKATVLELGKKMSSAFPSRTMHGAGKDALQSHWGSVKIDKSNDKLYSFINDVVNQSGKSWQLKQPILALVDQAQTAGIVPERDRFLLADEYENWESLADQYDIQFNEFIHKTAREALLWSNTQAFTNHIISFNDMIYLPTLFPIRVKQHKTIIGDEIQDFNPLQVAMLRKMLRKGGRFIGAGDQNQAIYAFRGALAESYQVIAHEFNATRLRLTVSFRCPQAVVLAAQQYVPEIEFAPGAPMGDVIHHEHMSFPDLPPVILCRNNAPLITLALRLFVEGYSVEVAGRDIGAGLKSLTKRIASGKKSDHMKSPEFYARLKRWADREIERKPRTKPRVRDKLACFKALCEHHRTLGDIRKHIDALYVNPNDSRRKPVQFHLTTIHKSKGREWPEILFLDPSLIPAKWAEQDWELRQEANLAYVGITRAQNILHYCNSENIY